MNRPCCNSCSAGRVRLLSLPIPEPFEEQIANIKGAYRLFYRSGLKLADATAELKALVPTQPELAPFVDFLAASERSIIR